jgi:hypothetical protein
MSQCSTNPCELRETPKPHVHVFGPKPVPPVLCQRAQRLVLKTRWHRFSETGGTVFSWSLQRLVLGSPEYPGFSPEIPGFSSNG